MTTSERGLKMLSTALDMEEKGRSFYEKAISSCKNELGKEIFNLLMKDEIIHVSRIKSIYAALSEKKVWSDSWKSFGEGHADLKPFFSDLARKHGVNIKANTSDIEALSVGIDFESKSVKFYEDELQKASDPMEKIFIQKMVAEEKSHFAVLNDTKFYLTDPAAWFAEKERVGLDGA